MKAKRLILGFALAACACLSAAASDAGSQALALYNAIHTQNWRSLYYLAAFSPAVKKQLEGPDKFAADVKKGISQSDGAQVVDKLFKSMKNIKVGKASVNGNRASVPTSVDLTVEGKTLHFAGVAKMVKDAGVWKWDLAYTDNIEKATSDSIQQLIGKPVQH